MNPERGWLHYRMRRILKWLRRWLPALGVVFIYSGCTVQVDGPLDRYDRPVIKRFVTGYADRFISALEKLANAQTKIAESKI